MKTNDNEAVTVSIRRLNSMKTPAIIATVVAIAAVGATPTIVPGAQDNSPAGMVADIDSGQKHAVDL